MGSRGLLVAALVLVPLVAPAQDARAFAGVWHGWTDDDLPTKRAEVIVSGGKVTGTIYDEGTLQSRFEGELRGQRLELLVWPAGLAPVNGVNGEAVMRGEYLVVRFGGAETPYARSGVPLLRSAAGSVEAEAFHKVVNTAMYYSDPSPSGSSAGTVTMTLIGISGTTWFRYETDALTIDAATLKATKSSPDVVREGHWRIVVRAGKPVVSVEWKDGGPVSYFDVVPSANEKCVALINGHKYYRVIGSY